MSCTNPLKTGIEFDLDSDEKWSKTELWDLVDDGYGNMIPFINKKLEDMKRSYSTMLPYSTGVWCTARARHNIWKYAIMPLDRDVAYYDTDSIKGTGTKVYEVVNNYNKMILERLKTVSSDLKIDISKFTPKDINGNVHPLGVFECETSEHDGGNYQEFITLGAKKYCVRDGFGDLHMTVSGVRKKAVTALNNDIRNFKDGVVIGYDEAQKLTHYYEDNQEPFYYIDVDGNKYYAQQRHSIILQPTTYTLGITDEYESLIDEYVGVIPDEI